MSLQRPRHPTTGRPLPPIGSIPDTRGLLILVHRAAYHGLTFHLTRREGWYGWELRRGWHGWELRDSDRLRRWSIADFTTAAGALDDAARHVPPMPIADYLAIGRQTPADAPETTVTRRIDPDDIAVILPPYSSLTGLGRTHLLAASTAIRIGVIATLLGHVRARQLVDGAAWLVPLQELACAIANCRNPDDVLELWDRLERIAPAEYISAVTTSLEEP